MTLDPPLSLISSGPGLLRPAHKLLSGPRRAEESNPDSYPGLDAPNVLIAEVEEAAASPGNRVCSNWAAIGTHKHDDCVLRAGSHALSSTASLPEEARENFCRQPIKSPAWEESISLAG